MIIRIEKEQLLKEFSDRLNQELDRIGYPDKSHGRQVQLAKALKLNQKGVRRWLEGLGMPSQESMVNLCKHIGVTPAYLRYGETLSSENNFASVNNSDMVHVARGNDVAELISFTNIGTRMLQANSEVSNEQEALVVTSGTSIVEGISMSGDGNLKFPAGCYIDWVLSDTAECGDYVIAELANGERIFRLLDKDIGGLVLVPLNRQYEISKGKFTILAIVVRKSEKIVSSLD